MVCIAAFIILILVGVFAGIISIWKPEVGRAYRKNLKRSAECFGKKVRLQKCETGFKDDVKNTLLAKVVIKHPTWVKPLSTLIEILSVIFVLVVLWAIVTALKSLLALWALGTCNVTTPASCSLSSESCSIDETAPEGFFGHIGNWFTEWGEIFTAIPEKFKTYDPSDYDFSGISVDAAQLNSLESSASAENSSTGDENSAQEELAEKPRALDIVDPGCIVCARSYKNQKSADFFEKYAVTIVPYAIHTASGFKFKNSDLIVRYLLSAESVKPGSALLVLDFIFAGEDSATGETYQTLMNETYSKEDAAQKLEAWLSTELTDEELVSVQEKLNSEEINAKIAENDRLVLEELNLKGIPSFIYDGKKHTGLYKLDE